MRDKLMGVSILLLAGAFLFHTMRPAAAEIPPQVACVPIAATGEQAAIAASQFMERQIGQGRTQFESISMGSDAEGRVQPDVLCAW
ncbi:MAG: hypothetical protein JRJ84_11175 [Deltaproteobacteria bacterium]|nr:hypothetical protein [Deltaproteobacteria bacterium]